jgi:adenylate cyclase
LHYNDEYFSNTKHAYDEKKSFEEYKPLGESLLVTNKMLKNAKKINAKIIISENMMKFLIASGQNIHIRQLDKVKIKNSTFCQRLFEVIPEEDFKQKKQIIEYFHCGQKLFEQRKWKEASEYFSRCLKIDKTDMSAAIYLQRCRNFISSSPKEDWNGVYEID